jgi:hypothetical protein
LMHVFLSVGFFFSIMMANHQLAAAPGRPFGLPSKRGWYAVALEVLRVLARGGLTQGPAPYSAAAARPLNSAEPSR